MISRGEIVKKVVQESGLSITRLAKKINISRAQLYIDFGNPEMSFDRILAIGKVLRHDFSADFKDLPADLVSLVNDEAVPYSTELNQCRDKLLHAQEQLISVLQELSLYKKKYGSDLTS